MKFGIIILAGILIIQADSFAQKKQHVYKIAQPHSSGKKQKLGFVGNNPNQNSKKAVRLTSGSGKSMGKIKRDHKPAKIGYVGDDPSLKPRKVHYMKPDPGNSRHKRSIVAENSIKKPKKQPKLIAAAKSPQNRNLKVPKQVNDKQMILPKMKGNKKAKKTKYEIKGANPAANVNTVKAKRVNDVQYRSSYKFDKQGSSNKKFFRKNKKD